MNDLIAINVVIADRSYRLKAQQKDEAAIRGTARLINEKITEFKTSLAGKDMQDYIAMVLLWFAVESSQSENHPVAEHEAMQAIEHISAMLDKALSNA